MNMLRENLQLRRATAADVDRLSAFNGIVHGRPNQPSRTIAARSRSWLDGSHPVVRPADWTVVEDLTTGEIVSTCALYATRLCRLSGAQRGGRGIGGYIVAASAFAALEFGVRWTSDCKEAPRFVV